MLLPPNPPEFDLQDDDGNPSPDGRVDRTDAGDWVGAQQYYYDNTLKPFVDQEIMNPDVQERASDNCYDQNGKKTKCHTASSSITFKFNPGTNIGGTS